MQRRILWFAFTFAAVPTLIFACGGRSDIDLVLADDAPDGGVKAGSAGTSGKAGAGGGSAGKAGGSAGQAGSGNAAGKKAPACIPGQQIECPCPGTDITGVQTCSKDGNSLSVCTGCPPPDNTAGGAGQTGGAGAGPGGGGKGGAAGKGAAGGGQPEGGSAGAQGGKSGTAGKGQDPPDAGDFFDSLPFPLPDSGPVGTCVNCLQSQCGDAINGCYNDTNCTQGIQCAITTCFTGGMGGTPMGGGPMGGNPFGGSAGGGVNFGCLLGCFNGDVTSAFAAIQAFQCITQTCGSDCGGGLLGDGGFPLGGLGGGPLGGLGGGQPGGQPGGSLPGSQPEAQLISGVRYIDDVRVPLPAEVPGYPWLQEALTPPAR
jgi:hypothetical protein